MWFETVGFSVAGKSLIVHRELCKKMKFAHTTKWYMHKADSVLVNATWKSSVEFWDTNRSLYPGQKTKPNVNKKNKRTCRIVNFAVPVNHREKIKESEKCECSTVEFEKNREKSQGDQRELAVTQTPVKDHQLTLVCKASEEKNYNLVVEIY